MLKQRVGQEEVRRETEENKTVEMVDEKKKLPRMAFKRKIKPATERKESKKKVEGKQNGKTERKHDDGYAGSWRQISKRALAKKDN